MKLLHIQRLWGVEIELFEHHCCIKVCNHHKLYVMYFWCLLQQIATQVLKYYSLGYYIFLMPPLEQRQWVSKYYYFWVMSCNNIWLKYLCVLLKRFCCSSPRGSDQGPSFQGSNTLPRAGTKKKTVTGIVGGGSVDDSEIVITKKLTGTGSSVRQSGPRGTNMI